MVQWVLKGTPPLSLFSASAGGGTTNYNISTTSSSLSTTSSNIPQNLFIETVSKAVVDAMPATTDQQGIGYLVLLVFEAVLEVVCVSLPGYIIARMGMFDTEQQKFISNLNVSLFTPCLIFSKLAAQLDPSKFGELVVIPVIFVIMTLVSYLSSLAVSKVFRLRKRARNFVVAMGVFGNSNSLPISLVLSLSFTISGLHWDQIPGDNDSDVASRGILYLMIFQQLGQIVRWTWGYNYLLQPSNQYSVEEGGTMGLQDEAPLPVQQQQAGPPSTDSIDDDSEWEYDEETQLRKAKHPDPFRMPGFNEFNGISSPVDERPMLFSWGSSYSRPLPVSASAPARAAPALMDDSTAFAPRLQLPKGRHHLRNTTTRSDLTESDHENGDTRTPFTPRAGSSSHTSPGSSRWQSPSRRSSSRSLRDYSDHDITSFPEPPDSPAPSMDENAPLVPKLWNKVRRRLSRTSASHPEADEHDDGGVLTRRLSMNPPPPWAQDLWYRHVKFYLMKVWDFMNPPLWAMIISVIVAFIPALKRLFFTPGTFVQNSVTRAVNQSGQVAVPLILVVLGANLANSSQAPKSNNSEEDNNVHKATKRHELKLLVASLVSRMVLPIVIMGPLLAIAAKYNPVSILDDPIFIIVCYLLTGAPSALQLSQICQLNGVYENVMARILFWSYVVVILPSTIVLVVTGLTVVKWAAD